MLHRLKRTTRLTNLQLCTVLIRCIIDLWLAVRHVHVAMLLYHSPQRGTHRSVHTHACIAPYWPHHCARIRVHASAASLKRKIHVCRRPYVSAYLLYAQVYIDGGWWAKYNWKLQDALHTYVRRGAHTHSHIHTPCTHFTTMALFSSLRPKSKNFSRFSVTSNLAAHA